MQKEKLKVITINMELIIPEEVASTKDTISDYLNTMLYSDPEFIGDFGPENITNIGDFE